MSVGRDELVIDGGVSSSRGSDQFKKALLDQELVKDAPSAGQVWSLIRDCGIRLSEDQSEPQLSLHPSKKVSVIFNFDEFQGSLVIRKC